MVEANKCPQFVGDKEILQDGLISQKQIAGSYNSFAGECVNEQLRSTFLNILDEEHRIQADIFCNLQNHGWYQVEPAQQEKIRQARQKFAQQP